MSALEQIRQRPILIISILGIALLLFILTAVDRPGELFSDNSTVAKVDGQKIDYLELQRRVEQQTEQMRNQGYMNVDQAMIQSQVLQSMISELLLNKEVEKLGIAVTDNELSEAMLGQTPHPFVAQMAYRYGMAPMDLYTAAFDPQKGGFDPSVSAQAKQIWADLEKNTREYLLQEKFGNLFAGVFTANELDAKAIFEDNASTSTIAYARVDYSTLSDDDFKPSDADIEALYKEEKERFRINTPMYLVDYIAVPIEPSDADREAAGKEVATALAKLKIEKGIAAVDNNPKFMINNVSSTKENLAPSLRSSLDQILADTVCQLPMSNNTYTIAKLLSATQQTDSVLIDMAQLTDVALTDSVMNLLDGGESIKNLGQELIAQTNDSLWIPLTNPGAAPLRGEIEGAAEGKYFVSTTQPGVLMKVRKRMAPVTVYDIAEITYQVIPSGATRTDLNSNFRKFLAENNTPAKFKSEAEKNGYNVMNAVVTPSYMAVSQIPDSRTAAKWALESKAGKVSNIFTINNESILLAVAVKDVYKGDYAPASDENVRDYLTNKLRNRMKGEKLVADFKGKASNIAGYASAMKTTADTTQVTFGQPMVRNFPYNESALNANVAAAKKGTVVGPIALNNSVVVFEVVNVDNSGRQFDFENDAMTFNQREVNSLQRNISAILLGNKKVSYRLAKFVPKSEE